LNAHTRAQRILTRIDKSFNILQGGVATSCPAGVGTRLKPPKYWNGRVRFQSGRILTSASTRALYSSSLRIMHFSRMNFPSCGRRGCVRRGGFKSAAVGCGAVAVGRQSHFVLLGLFICLHVLPAQPAFAAIAKNVHHHVKAGQKQPLLWRPIVHVEHAAEQERPTVPALKGLRHDLVVRGEVRSARRAAVDRLCGDVLDEKPAHDRRACVLVDGRLGARNRKYASSINHL